METTLDNDEHNTSNLATPIPFVNKFFRAIDFIGSKPKLKVGSDSRHKTLLGGSICLLVIFSIVVEFYFFGEDLFYKRNPQVTLSTIYDETPRRFNL